MELYYENSRHEKLDFMSFPYIARDIDELLDFDWEYVNDEMKIRSFTRRICEIPLSINIITDSEEEYLKAANRFFEVAEYDVLQNDRGKLWLNGQYVICNIISNKKTDWCMDVDFHIANIRIVTEYPFWITEEFLSYQKYNEGEKSSDFLNHPYDFPYDYTSEQYGMSSITNDHYAPVHFEMIIYGPVVEPQIRINGYPYIVHTTVEENEYLTIDSRNKKVYRTLRNGEAVNEFNNRDFEHSIFEPIPPGKHPLNWGGNFGVDITMFKERSEPAWKPRRK